MAYFPLYKLRTEWALENVRIGLLLFVPFLMVYDSRSAALAVQTWDQITLWDGAVLKGVEAWDTYEVMREWYGAATPV